VTSFIGKTIATLVVARYKQEPLEQNRYDYFRAFFIDR
jgi:hypothetical protein